MPVVGLGVYQNYTAKVSCLEAFKAGYRYVRLSHTGVRATHMFMKAMLTQLRRIGTKHMSGLPFARAH